MMTFLNEPASHMVCGFFFGDVIGVSWIHFLKNREIYPLTRTLIEVAGCPGLVAAVREVQALRAMCSKAKVCHAGNDFGNA
jgi:hypothetical protein